MYNIIEEPDWRSGEEREQVQAEMERGKFWKEENGKREVLGETLSGKREGRREGQRETEREKRSISSDMEEAAAAMEDNSVTRKIFPI